MAHALLQRKQRRTSVQASDHAGHGISSEFGLVKDLILVQVDIPVVLYWHCSVTLHTPWLLCNDHLLSQERKEKENLHR